MKGILLPVMTPSSTPDASGFIYNYPLPIDTALMESLTRIAIGFFFVGVVLLVILIAVLFDRDSR